MQGSRTEIDMKNKITDKLFELAYTDYMTEVQNRNAYEERLKKLRKPSANLSRMTVIVIDIHITLMCKCVKGACRKDFKRQGKVLCFVLRLTQ